MKWLNELSIALLNDGYARESETIEQAFYRVANTYCYGDFSLRERIYNAVKNNWFMFATPVMTNAKRGEWKERTKKKDGWKTHYFATEDTSKGLPISCFALDVPDTVDGQVAAMQELATLSISGGGVGLHNNIRGTSKKAPGPIPYMKVMDSTIGYFKQSGNRRGAVAMYMDVTHPDIIEHIRFRVPGGDPKRRSDNRTQFHCAVNLTDDFIDAVLNDKEIELKCPEKGTIYESVSARSIWQEIIETRALTGEPYLLKIDQANRAMPETQKQLGLKISGSNLCSEILLPTNSERTFVCCLSSLNLDKYDEWKDTTLVRDLTRFLDNVLESFIENCPDALHKARYSAMRERAIGIGSFGLASYLQSKMIAFESGGFNSSSQHNYLIFKHIKEEAVKASKQLAIERGEAPDMVGSGMRNSRLLAVAPNASSSSLANSSPSIEPIYRNIFTQSTRVGNFVVKNKYLEKLLEEKGMNTSEVWKDIELNDGSVQHLDFLSEHEKKVFKTAMEIDQHWVVELANIRGQFICQAQSLNLFFPAGSERSYVNSVHLKFLKSEHVHTLYYYRTERESKISLKQQTQKTEETGECLSCHG